MVYLFPRLDPPLDPVWQQDQPGCCLLPQWLVWSRSWRCAWLVLEPTLMTGEELGSFCLRQRSKQLLLRAWVCTFIFTRCNSASHGVTVDVYLLLWIVMLFVQILCLHQSMDVSCHCPLDVFTVQGFILLLSGRSIFSISTSVYWCQEQVACVCCWVSHLCAVHSPSDSVGVSHPGYLPPSMMLAQWMEGGDHCGCESVPCLAQERKCCVWGFIQPLGEKFEQRLQVVICLCQIWKVWSSSVILCAYSEQ